jgi:hypothetical protein
MCAVVRCWTARAEPTGEGRAGKRRSRPWTGVGLAVGAGLFLTYVLVSLGNPKADLQITYSPWSTLPTGVELQPLEAIEWLPHTYDRQRTWPAFWKYLTMGMAFFALRGWWLGGPPQGRRTSVPDEEFPPRRLRVFLWTLSISTAALALEGILQRLGGTQKLLSWFTNRTNRSSLLTQKVP